jgi:hypothetical protein
MLHEVTDQAAFLAEVRACFKPGGRLLIVEPRIHVGSAAFQRSVEVARSIGWEPIGRPAIALSRAKLFSVEQTETRCIATSCLTVMRGDRELGSPLPSRFAHAHRN